MANTQYTDSIVRVTHPGPGLVAVTQIERSSASVGAPARVQKTEQEQLSLFTHPRNDPQFPGASWDMTGAGEPDMVD